jgi:hypothetical protein
MQQFVGENLELNRRHPECIYKCQHCECKKYFVQVLHEHRHVSLFFSAVHGLDSVPAQAHVTLYPAGSGAAAAYAAAFHHGVISGIHS